RVLYVPDGSYGADCDRPLSDYAGTTRVAAFRTLADRRWRLDHGTAAVRDRSHRRHLRVTRSDRIWIHTRSRRRGSPYPPEHSPVIARVELQLNAGAFRIRFATGPCSSCPFRPWSRVHLVARPAPVVPALGDMAGDHDAFCWHL